MEKATEGHREDILEGLRALAAGAVLPPSSLADLARRTLKILEDFPTSGASDASSYSELFHAIVQNCPDMIFVKEAEELRFVHFNPAGEELLGMTSTQMQGKQDADLLSATEAEAFNAMDRETLRVGHLVEIPEESIQTHRGSRLLHTKKIPIFASDGRPKYLLGISRDITDAKAAQVALVDSENRLAQVLEVAKVLVWETDVAGRLTFLGGRVEELLSGARGHWLHERLAEVFPGVDPVNLCAEGKRFSEFEVQLDSLGDDSPWVSVSGFARTDQHGDTIGYRGAVLDITDSKRRQAMLVEVAQLAEKANAAKSIFLATMSHEIRTPLNGIMGMATLLKGTPLCSEQQDFLSTILRCSDSLMSILNDVLDYSKIEAGRVELEENCFDPADILEEAVDLLGPAAVAKGVEVVVELPPQGQRFRGDSTRVRQVINNLLSNAVKFTTQGEIRLSLQYRIEEAKQGRALFQISDSGIGIPAERLGRLFQPFSQIDVSTTRQYGGTGLGLAICQRLLQLMGGTIWAESEQGRGTKFCFELPLTLCCPDDATELLPVRRVKLALCHQPLVDSLVPLLSSWGLQVVQAGEYDVLIFESAALDSLSPEEGRHAVRIHVGPYHKNAPPCDGQISKPIRPSNLHQLLVRLLRGTPVAIAAGEPAAPKEIRHTAILLADDNEVNQKVARLMLQRLGYSCDAVANGLEVQQAVLNKRYDIILMDIQMPEMDGLQASRWLRQREDHQPYIIALTAGVTVEERTRAFEAGMQDFVTKPVRLEELKLALERGASILGVP